MPSRIGLPETGCRSWSLNLLWRNIRSLCSQSAVDMVNQAWNAFGGLSNGIIESSLSVPLPAKVAKWSGSLATQALVKSKGTMADIKWSIWVRSNFARSDSSGLTYWPFPLNLCDEFSPQVGASVVSIGRDARSLIFLSASSMAVYAHLTRKASEDAETWPALSLLRAVRALSNPVW